VSSTERIKTFLQEAQESGIFPGASLLVAEGGELVFEHVLGMAACHEEPRAMTERIRFDLASLTKAVGTSLAAMIAVAEGLASLEEPLGERLPLPVALARQPVWHLLAHSSGLPAWAPLYEEVDRAVLRGEASSDRASRRAWMRNRVATTALEYRPGEVSLYSDLGFMVLEWWLETIFGERLDAVLEERVFSPLSLADTGYVDLDASERQPPELFAATERCPTRGRIISGEVHDLNTWAMGGICGQAGIFSTARDLHALLGSLWRSWCGVEKEPIPCEVIRRFWTPCSVPGSAFRLGWDGPSREGYSSAGRHMPAEAVGHLGFTGCSLWLAPSPGLWVIFLSNRVHPSVARVGIREFRPALHDLVLGELGLGARR
jgi:CubicO group peptidase (beta-lactamase class C family)